MSYVCFVSQVYWNSNVLNLEGESVRRGIN
ncbi:hypothetical protein [Escherichia phage UPEC06]|nr:hypothetical protein [Escherichia phage UPEC06]